MFKGMASTRFYLWFVYVLIAVQLFEIFFSRPELETLEWDILNPDRLIWRLITRGEQPLFNLEIKKKRRSSINLDIHHSFSFQL